MNVKLWGVALAIGITLLVLWWVRGPSATPTQSTIEPSQTHNDSRQAQAVSVSQAVPRGSMPNTAHEGPTKAVGATDTNMRSSPTVVSVGSGGQSTGEADSFSLRNVDFLDSDLEFTRVADVLRLSGSRQRTQQQQSYEAFFAKLPPVVTGAVQVQDVLCGQKLCIGTVVGNQPLDLDVFFASMARSARVDPPIYSIAAVEAQVDGSTVRRFAFSIDPSIREVPFKMEANAK